MHRTLSLPFALLMALPTVACLDRSGTSDDTQDTQDVSSDIEQSNGGFDTADEPPEFGLQADFTAAAIESDSQATDPLAGDPATTAADTASAAAGFRAILVWGKIPADKDATESRDWSGKLVVSRGGLLVRRTIAFEDRTDQLLPRVSLDTVAFASVTRPFVDGLALTVLDPPSATATGDQTLTYTSNDGASVYSFDLAQLSAGPIVVDAGNGFKMVLIGQPRRSDACDRGFMRGRWHELSARLGRFLGVVTDENGAPTGHVRGVFGQRRNGDSVLFGKFIDAAGHFRGILAGTYDNGQYQAHWIDRGGDHGTAHGVYFAGQAASAGQFLGRWAESSCTSDPPTTGKM
jgi:hypothetical protein